MCSNRGLCWTLILTLGALSAQSPGSVAAAGGFVDENYQTEIEEWQHRRVEGLTAETGWLSLIGLFWLQEGSNSVGSDPTSDIVLPADKAPLHAGSLTLADAQVGIRAAPDSGITHEGIPVAFLELAVDTTGNPSILDLGDLQFYVLERSGKYALRVRDRQHPARFEFPGIETFPVNVDWRITGRLETHDPPRTIPIPNVLGQVSYEESPGTVVFEIDGRSHRIDALAGPNETLFLIFGDRTSGRETYGGGRFVYSEPVAEDGTVVIDFNKAYNPPCAFTDFATCPLPPRQNKLAIRIDAGEKKFGVDH